MKYPCPCCGSPSFDEKPGKSYEVCPVCLWEDDPVQFEDETFAGGANKVSLAQARENFRDFGISDIGLIIGGNDAYK